MPPAFITPNFGRILRSCPATSTSRRPSRPPAKNVSRNPKCADLRLDNLQHMSCSVQLNYRSTSRRPSRPPAIALAMVHIAATNARAAASTKRSKALGRKSKWRRPFRDLNQKLCAAASNASAPGLSGILSDPLPHEVPRPPPNALGARSAAFRSFWRHSRVTESSRGISRRPSFHAWHQLQRSNSHYLVFNECFNQASRTRCSAWPAAFAFWIVRAARALRVDQARPSVHSSVQELIFKTGRSWNSFISLSKRWFEAPCLDSPSDDPPDQLRHRRDRFPSSLISVVHAPASSRE